ncbi:MAG: hypothetical protein VYC95_08635 [Verrucomicrobiota bacterium]|nr:hypothetical protein [Verrucomicrobiota bacterium]
MATSRRLARLVHATANRAALGGLHSGMDREAVLSQMGTQVRTGSSGYFTNLVLRNPHAELYLSNPVGTSLSVLLYLTDPENLDDEWEFRNFTPVLLRSGRLAGRGWGSLKTLLQRSGPFKLSEPMPSPEAERIGKTFSQEIQRLAQVRH